MRGIYVLRLEGDNFYVGSSENVERRITSHMNGKGSVWTRLHPPVEVVETMEVNDPEKQKKFERYRTLHLMMRKGWERVRGAGWTKRNLTKPKSLRQGST